jgi:heat shock protein 4
MSMCQYITCAIMLCRMAEQMYTVASDSETTGEDKSQPSFPDVAIGIDIGTSKCSVAVWNGHQVELLKNTRNQKGMRSYVMFKDDNLSAGVTGGATPENAQLRTLAQPQQAAELGEEAAVE